MQESYSGTEYFKKVRMRDVYASESASNPSHPTLEKILSQNLKINVS